MNMARRFFANKGRITWIAQLTSSISSAKLNGDLERAKILCTWWRCLWRTSTSDDKPNWHLWRMWFAINATALDVRRGHARGLAWIVEEQVHRFLIIRDYKSQSGIHLGRKVTMRQFGPGMIQQLQTQCPACYGEGQVIDKKDQCTGCQGAYLGYFFFFFSFSLGFLFLCLCFSFFRFFFSSFVARFFLFRFFFSPFLFLSCSFFVSFVPTYTHAHSHYNTTQPTNK